MTRKEYDKLVNKQKEASRNNDYSKMIFAGDPIHQEMKRFEQDNICTHGSISTIGDVDICNYCGKRF